MTGRIWRTPSVEDAAETTRKLIRAFVETPPAKTMADVKAASEVYEANAQDQNVTGTAPAGKPST